MVCMRWTRVLLCILVVLVFSGCGKKKQESRVETREALRDTLPPLPIHPAAFVDLVRLDSTIILDIRYATANNFTGEVLYPEACCYLRLCVAESLVSVSRKAKVLGYRLKVYDGYRPQRVQYRMWELVPDSRYVADPKKGSRHNRGTAVDVTLVDSAGSELDMGTGFDDFSQRAHRNYAGLSKEQRGNRERLTKLMTSTGFTSIPTEWWHYDYYDGSSFPLMDVSFDSLKFLVPESSLTPSSITP